MHSSDMLSIGLMIVLFLPLLANGNLSRNKREVCESEECQAASNYILSKLNTSVDPCQDMYQFSCGRWPDMSKVGKHVDIYSITKEVTNNIDQQLIQSLQEEDSTFRCENSSAIKKLKYFYQSCVNTETIGKKAALPIIEVIDSYGSWTVSQTKQPWDEKNWNLKKALSKAHKVWEKVFWTLTTGRDLKNPLRNILIFEPSKLASSINYIELCEKEDDLMQVAIKFGAFLGGDKKIIKDKMSSMFTLQRQLTKLHVPFQSFQKHERKTLGEFQKIMGPWINIEDYLEGIFGVRMMKLNDEVIVQSPYYFSQLKTIIEETSNETLANYIMWNIIIEALTFSPEKISYSMAPVSNNGETKNTKELPETSNESIGESYEKYTNEQISVAKKSLKQKTCIERAKDLLPFLSSALFVDKNVSMETITKIVTAIDDIEHEFIKELQVIEWLDDKTRKNLIEKAKSMSNKVGYPDWLLNPEKLDAKYETLIIEDNEFLKNVIHITEFHRNKEFKSFFKPPDIKQWKSSPATVNAYYSPLDNELAILAGILQPPIISPYYPRSYVYGGIGRVLGHELVHGFDNEGRLYDKDGIYGDTWTPHVAEEFEKRAKCFVDQYSKYSFNFMPLNGKLTLGENIADNGGMKIAYRAYQSSINPHDFSLPGLNFTDDQLFFIGVSQYWCSYYSRQAAVYMINNDPHALRQFRVRGTMANSKEFAKAFKCEKNTPMNPEKKCEIW